MNWEYWEVDDCYDSWVAEFSAHLRKNGQLEKYASFQQDFLVAADEDTKIDLVWA